MRKQLTTLLVLVITISAIGAESTKLDLSSLYGKRPAELKATFPTLSTAKSGGSAKIENWKGWEAVYLSFNSTGRLVSISFNPKTPMQEVDAKRILKDNFGVSLPKSNEKRALALIAYRNMKGKIETVNLSFVDWKKKDKRIKEVGVFFNLGWND